MVKAEAGPIPPCPLCSPPGSAGFDLPSVVLIMQWESWQMRPDGRREQELAGWRRPLSRKSRVGTGNPHPLQPQGGTQSSGQLKTWCQSLPSAATASCMGAARGRHWAEATLG